MRIPPRLDAAAEQLTTWVNRHRWLTGSLTVAAAALILLAFLPAVAGFTVGAGAGICIGLGIGHDRRLLLASRHDADQLLIGRLRKQIAELEARPAADAATTTIRYITDPKEIRQ